MINADSPLESFLVCCAVSQQIAKLRLQLQRSKQVSRQSKEREQSSSQLSQQAQHGNACVLQVSLRPTTARTNFDTYTHLGKWRCGNALLVPKREETRERLTNAELGYAGFHFRVMR